MSKSIALFPGSFNDVHRQHFEIAMFAEEYLKLPVVFEICTNNVDKPVITDEEVVRRASLIAQQGFEIWKTNWSSFLQKSISLREGDVIICGHDTFERVVDPEYYHGSIKLRNRCIRNLKPTYVFPRGDKDWAYVTFLQDKEFYGKREEYKNFHFIDPREFNPSNLSSSELRNKK